MELASLILSSISTLAAVISAIAAIRAKNEVEKLTSIMGTKNVSVGGNLCVENSGSNKGIVSGVNSGEIIK